MSAIKSILLMGLLSAGALATPMNKRTLCQPGPITINGQPYQVSCGIDRLGGDSGTRLQTDINGCAQACAAQSCASAQYHEDIGFCYLKNVQNPAVLASGVDTIDPGTGCTDGPVTVNGVSCTISCNVDQHGGDYSSSRPGSDLGCAAACAADSNCVTAQYNRGNGYCYLKKAANNPGPQVSSTNTDTIVCQNGS